MDSLDSFGEWLTQRRKALDLTRVELAKCAGCSVSALRKIEADERRPSKQLAELLADCLAIPPDTFVTFLRAARGMQRVEQLGSPLPAASLSSPGLDEPQPRRLLPAPTTPLIGREAELATLEQMLEDPACRLLSLVGPGGIGKTRLALEAAGAQQEAYVDGVFFITLAATADAAFIAPTIAQAIGLNLSGPIDPQAQLINYLGSKQMLLLLDNLEHLLNGVEVLASMLESAPGLKLLVTSRERLELHGEWVFEVGGLPVPAHGQVERLEDYSGVQLFVQCARRARTGFQMAAEDRVHVARICQLVEGMPLAIELAAAWVRVLSCWEIAHELESGLDILTTKLRDVPERHRSMWAVFDHSWRLLSKEEQLLLSRLSVFRGGFVREAAEQVADVNLSLLSALISKSLVRQAESGRFDLHEVVRQYALSRLEDGEEHDRTHDLHSQYYLTLLADRESQLKSAAQREVIDELMNEIGNVRAAWAWAVQQKNFALLGKAMRCFGWFYEMRGNFREGLKQLKLVSTAIPASSADQEQQSVLGQALAQQGLLSFRRGRHDLALTCFEQSLTILRPYDDPALLLDPLHFYGTIMFLRGEVDRAQSLMAECLAGARAVDDRWFEAYALFNLGYIASLRGLYVEAYEQMNDGLAIWRELGDPRHTALGLNWISPVAIKLGRYEESAARLKASLALSTGVGDRWGMGTAYRHLGLLNLAQGNIAEAQSLIRQSLELFAEFVTGWDIIQSLVSLAEATVAAGDLAEARRIYLDALQLGAEAQATPLMLDSLIGLAELDAEAGQARWALQLALMVRNHAASTQETRDRAALLETQLVTQLTDEQCQAARKRAGKQSLPIVLEEILGENLIPAS